MTAAVLDPIWQGERFGRQSNVLTPDADSRPMRFVSVSRSISISVGLVIAVTSCSQAATTQANLSDEVLAYTDVTTDVSGCDSVSDLLLSELNILDTDAKADLLEAVSSISGDAVALLANLSAVETQAQELGTVTEIAKDKGSVEADQTSAVQQELDDLTSELCGFPVWSAAYVLRDGEILPASLPCFVYRPTGLDGPQYVATDCADGQAVYLHSDGHWDVELEASAETTTTWTPPTTVVKVTRPDPTTTIATIAPTTVPTTAPAPVDGEDAEEGEDGQTTTTEEPVPTSPPEI